MKSKRTFLEGIQITEQLLNDVRLKHDSLPLGKGRINWVMVKPHLMHKDFIFKIDLRESNHQDCTPMIESAEYLLSIRP